MKKRLLFLIIVFLNSFASYSQDILFGMIRTNDNISVFAANVYFKSIPQKGAITDLEGKFQIEYTESKIDTLVISCIGFQTKEIKLSEIDTKKALLVVLEEQASKLDEVVVKYTDPISEQFSIIKMDMLKDVYLNPMSQGDPLKAITFLPASSNTDETADVSFRGSSADRSRVILNGVPVINPVRAANLSNQGFFSLFNPEVIEKQYVYASNPPLTYGNISAGLVEIQTKRNLSENQLQLSLSLASTGFFLSQKSKKGKSFVQAYGNYQFSEAYINIQRNQLINIEKFSTKDIGVNFHSRLSPKVTFNSFNYFINEGFSGKNIEAYTYKGNPKTYRQRFLTINNLSIYSKNGILRINNGTSIDLSEYLYGNISNKNNYKNVFTSVNYKWFILDNTDIQFGISHDYHNHIFEDKMPNFYYALSPNSPSTLFNKQISNNIVEMYAYTLWNINDRWSFSSGMRSNIPVNKQDHYFSSQLSFKFKLSDNNVFLLSGGEYHNYTTPNYYLKSYNLLKSYQLVFDYTFKYKNTLLKTSSYFKNETGKQISFFTTNEVNTFGVEFFIEQIFLKYFKYTLSNSFIHQEQTIDNNVYRGTSDFDYFLKTSLQYFNPKWFTIALVYIDRPGTYYNPINGGIPNTSIGFYEPNFSNNLYSEQYKNYHRFDLSISKYIPLKNNSLVFFASVNNIFNQKNQRLIQYNSNYTEEHFDYYQSRNIYFGMVWYLNY